MCYNHYRVVMWPNHPRSSVGSLIVRNVQVKESNHPWGCAGSPVEPPGNRPGSETRLK